MKGECHRNKATNVSQNDVKIKSDFGSKTRRPP